LVRTACAPRWRAQAAERQDPAEGRYAVAQLRGRADAIRPAFPRRRQRAYCAADRRQGHESRVCRRAYSGARVCRILPLGPDRATRRLFAEGLAAGVEGATFLLVDDANPASFSEIGRASC